MTKVIDIAKDFSKYPAGRVVTDGNFSGERLRDDYLLPALNENAKITVILDGTRGYGSSFLEESFGGLVRVHGFAADELIARIDFISSRPIYVKEIIGYIKNAGRS